MPEQTVVEVTDRDRAIVEWIGRLGAASAADVMARFGMGRTATYRRLAALVDQGLLATERLLHGQPALYVATRDGLQWARLARLEPCRVGVASARHFALCAQLAVVLERTEPGYRVWSEREVRVAELDAGGPVASAELGRLPDGRPRLRRADLVLMPREQRPPAGRGRGRAGGEVGAPARGDLPRLGALPAGRSRPLLRLARRCPCRGACRGARPGPRRDRDLFVGRDPEGRS